MDILDLVRALLGYDALAARQWVVDAHGVSLDWPNVIRPEGASPQELALAAGLVELLAARANRIAPPWTATIGAAAAPRYLVRAAAELPRLRRLCEQEGPPALRARLFYAPPDFLTFA